MHNQVYSRYLYQMLMEYGIVSVPSLGTFLLEPIKAAFDKDHTRLNPPGTKLKFLSEVDKSSTFLIKLVESGMSELDANLLQNAIMQDYALSLDKQLPFEIGGFGTVVNHLFLEKNPSVFDLYPGLEPVFVKVLPRGFKKDNDKYLGMNSSQNQHKAEKYFSKFWTFIGPALIAIFAGIMIILWFLSDPKTGSEININSASNDSLQIIDKKINLSDDDILESIDSIMEKDSIQYFKSTQEEISNIESNRSVSADGGKNVFKNLSEETKADKTCVVIIGAFKQRSNADKMIKKITSQGYRTYRELKNGMNRVGISYDCVHNDPDMFKAKVKKQFNKDAWHLHDTLM
ncbi:MAG: SPOR domain-containing protein [Saprospiraceae bacterium]|nr:SPOR domain-containing protein [Saprospiraceae bacterium]